MCLRKLGEYPPLTAIHAAKFYGTSNSPRSSMKAAQDRADDLIAIGDAHEHPHGQYATIMAYIAVN